MIIDFSMTAIIDEEDDARFGRRRLEREARMLLASLLSS